LLLTTDGCIAPAIGRAHFHLRSGWRCFCSCVVSFHFPILRIRQQAPFSSLWCSMRLDSADYWADSGRAKFTGKVGLRQAAPAVQVYDLPNLVQLPGLHGLSGRNNEIG
jgi:hypothetical protein